MKLILRPLNGWPRPSSAGTQSQFTAPWSDTLDLLEREVGNVRRRDQVDEPVILQLDAPESAFRLDGGIRANAKVNYHGVIVSFESKHGSLRYLCDTYGKVAWKVRGTQQPWQGPTSAPSPSASKHCAPSIATASHRMVSSTAGSPRCRRLARWKRP